MVITLIMLYTLTSSLMTKDELSFVLLGLQPPSTLGSFITEAQIELLQSVMETYDRGIDSISFLIGDN